VGPAFNSCDRFNEKDNLWEFFSFIIWVLSSLFLNKLIYSFLIPLILVQIVFMVYTYFLTNRLLLAINIIAWFLYFLSIKLIAVALLLFSCAHKASVLISPADIYTAHLVLVYLFSYVRIKFAIKISLKNNKVWLSSLWYVHLFYEVLCSFLITFQKI